MRGNAVPLLFVFVLLAAGGRFGSDYNGSSSRWWWCCQALATTPTTKTISIVTGANGFLGKEIVRHLLQQSKEEVEQCNGDVLCLVRSHRVQTETDYWLRYSKEHHNKSGTSNTSPSLKVLPYDMIDGGQSLKKVLMEQVLSDDKSVDKNKNIKLHVYHVASVFGPTENHEQTALDNVQGTKDLVKTVAEWYREDVYNQRHHDVEPPRIIFTSSMAAVRATGQIPTNQKYYTHKDWNNMSKLGENWGSSYQWSKMESERVAWEECQRYNEMGLPSKDDGEERSANAADVLSMTSICPSFIFGPVDVNDEALSSSYSIQLVQEWMEGKSPVQSRLCVDVRDAAKIHIEAAKRNVAKHERYVCSCERRISSLDIGNALMTYAGDSSGVHCDTNFKGGAIPIGEKEVDAAERLKTHLGVTCRPVDETFRDMAKSLSSLIQK